ncbi:MAG: RsmE family RNA methyltransferase [Rectinemataceae bacterium]
MNLLTLEKSEIGALLPPGDRRALHISRVLGKGPGDQVAAGMLTIDPFGPAPGSLGRATVRKLDAEGLVLDYEAQGEAPPLWQVRLLLGFPRPIQGARLLRDLASLGVGEIVLTGTMLGERSYLESDLWKKGGYLAALREGAEQAGNPRVPRASREWSVARAIGTMSREEGAGRFVLHPGEGFARLGSAALTAPLTLAIGSERGWTEEELSGLEEAGFVPLSLGDRILKTETACVAAVALALGQMGYL